MTDRPSRPPGQHLPAGVFDASGAARSPYDVHHSGDTGPSDSAAGDGVQDALFEVDRGPSDDELGYRGPTAQAAVGITYRQLDYWARTGLVEPSIRSAKGSGSQRLYSFRDILVLKVVKKLLDAGVSLQNVRAAVTHLRSRGVDDLARITLMSDGSTVYEFTSPEEMVDLLQGGQGVFVVAVSAAYREVEGTLAELPGERASGAADPGGGAAATADELASRRRRRSAS